MVVSYFNVLYQFYLKNLGEPPPPSPPQKKIELTIEGDYINPR